MVSNLFKKAKKAARKLLRKLGIWKKKKKEGEKEKIDQDKNEIQLTKKFLMSGSPHTLTSYYKNGKVKITMASANPGELIPKVKNEIKEHAQLVKTRKGKDREKHKRIATELNEIIVEYNQVGKENSSNKRF